MKRVGARKTASLVQAGYHGDIVRIVGRDQTVADEEIDIDQIAVELEIEPIADPLGDVLNRPKFEFFDLAILVYRREVRRQFKVVAKNLIRFHAVGASMAIG
mgnify:CR=1 FL=1